MCGMVRRQSGDWEVHRTTPDAISCWLRTCLSIAAALSRCGTSSWLYDRIYCANSGDGCLAMASRLVTVRDTQVFLWRCQCVACGRVCVLCIVSMPPLVALRSSWSRLCAVCIVCKLPLVALCGSWSRLCVVCCVLYSGGAARLCAVYCM